MGQVIGPDFIALQVRDLELSKRFYTEKPNLEVADRNPPGAVLFKTAPIPFAIRNPMINLDASKHLGWGVAIWLACENPDELHAKLQGFGVKILTGLQDGPFGRFFTFEDPDGYAVTLHTKTGHSA